MDYDGSFATDNVCVVFPPVDFVSHGFTWMRLTFSCRPILFEGAYVCLSPILGRIPIIIE